MVWRERNPENIHFVRIRQRSEDIRLLTAEPEQLLSDKCLTNRLPTRKNTGIFLQGGQYYFPDLAKQGLVINFLLFLIILIRYSKI